jgi:hypothetical protein
MPFAVIIRRRPSGLWYCGAFYKNRRGQTVVSGSWHPDRPSATREARYLIL